MPLYIWNGSQYVRVDDGAGNIQIKNVVYDANKDGIIDADKIAPHTHTLSDINLEGDFIPSADKTYNIGSRTARWLDGWFAGSLGLGVIAEPGTTLKVDVIYEDSYVEVASDSEEKTYPQNTSGASDWVVSGQSTFTENGIATKVKIQFDAYWDAGGGGIVGYAYFYENGVERISWDLADIGSWKTFSGEFVTTLKTADYELKISTTSFGGSYHVHIRNRHLFMKKLYLGIKAGE